MVDVCLLGCGGMMPLPNRRLTSLLCRVSGKMILIDCGEGTQVGIKMAGWGFKGIGAVCFTHYHADHIAGLPGFLSTLGNSGKTDPLTLLGPSGLAEVVRGLTVIGRNCRLRSAQLRFRLTEAFAFPGEESKSTVSRLTTICPALPIAWK